jgi:hypothetical protein
VSVPESAWESAQVSVPESAEESVPESVPESAEESAQVSAWESAQVSEWGCVYDAYGHHDPTCLRRGRHRQNWWRQRRRTSS